MDDQESDSDLSIENVEVSDHESNLEQDLSDNISWRRVWKIVYYFVWEKIKQLNYKRKSFRLQKLGNIINAIAGPKECARYR